MKKNWRKVGQFTTIPNKLNITADWIFNFFRIYFEEIEVNNRCSRKCFFSPNIQILVFPLRINKKKMQRKNLFTKYITRETEFNEFLLVFHLDIRFENNFSLFLSLFFIFMSINWSPYICTRWWKSARLSLEKWKTQLSSTTDKTLITIANAACYRKTGFIQIFSFFLSQFYSLVRTTPLPSVCWYTHTHIHVPFYVCFTFKCLDKIVL